MIFKLTAKIQQNTKCFSKKKTVERKISLYTELMFISVAMQCTEENTEADFESMLRKY